MTFNFDSTTSIATAAVAAGASTPFLSFGTLSDSDLIVD
jgi:hypothetical protein